MTRTITLPPLVQSYVREYAARRRWLAFWRRLGLTACFALTWALAACVADRFLKLPPALRWTLLACGATGVVLLMLRPLGRLLGGRVDWVATAAAIERRSPRFGQRLMTVVSQQAMPAQLRGSGELLDRLSEDVAREIPVDRPRILLSWTAAAPPWFFAAALGVAIAVAWQWPWLGLPRLALRLGYPDGPVPPVTTTQITVVTGPTRVEQGEPLTVEARVQDPGPRPVVLHLSQRGTPRKTWSATEMSPGRDGRYMFTLPAVEQELSYYIEAGDATSPTRDVRVLRHPAVADLRVRYDYPAYTGRGPLISAAQDGIVEALAGTHATLWVEATEPLREAALTAAGGRVSLRPTSDPRVHEIEFAVDADRAYQLDLVSDQGVSVRSGRRILVRSVPDHPPVISVLQPDGDLHLDPKAVFTVWYRALDDYGVRSVVADVQVNDGHVRRVESPVNQSTGTDPRRIESGVDVDFAPLGLKVGDLIAVTLTADDGVGQKATSETRHVIVVPRSIDLQTYQRLSDLRQCVQLAAATAESLEAARRAWQAAAGLREVSRAVALISAGGVRRHLSSAAEAIGLFRQSLSRAVTRSNTPELSNALAHLVDSAVVCSRTVAGAADRLARTPDAGSVAAEIDAALAHVMALRTDATTLAAGEQAAAVMADRANLRSAEAAPSTQPAAAERVRRNLERTRADVAAAAAALGVDPTSPDVDAHLQKIVDAGRALAAARTPVDWPAVAERWAKDPAAEPVFADRLQAAAEAEVIRPDADPVWARDLQLAARAARASERVPMTASATNPASMPTTGPNPRAGFSDALATLQAVHQSARRPATRPVAPVDASSAADRATAARAHLRRRAGEVDILLSAAEAVSRQQAEAPAADATDFPPAATAPLEQSLLDAARAFRTESAFPEQEPASPDTPPPPDASVQPSRPWEQVSSRESAMAAVQRVQEALTSLPEAFGRLTAAVDAQYQASARADQARREADTAPPERQASVRRLADQAMALQTEAEDRVAVALQSVSPTAADALSTQLHRFTPETSAATAAIDQQLAPALRDVRRAVAAGDQAGLSAAADQARRAVGQVQDGLRAAQVALAERDPLVAARRFAGVAATPPQRPLTSLLAVAQGPPPGPSGAPGVAQGATTREVPGDQLVLLPTFWSLLRPAVSRRPLDAAAPTGPGAAMAGFEPGQAQSPDADSASGHVPLRGPDPPGYADALQAYFEAIGKAASGSGGTIK